MFTDLLYGYGAQAAKTIKMKVAESNKIEILNVVRDLGAGAFGSVQLVENAQGRKFALKNIDLNWLSSTERFAFLRLIRNEVSALKAVGMLQGFAKEGNKVQILMNFFDGEQVWKKMIGMTSPEKQALIKQCFAALRDVHAKGYLHCDPHDANFLLGKDGQVGLIDFGLARPYNIFRLGNDLKCFAYFFLDPKSPGRQLMNLFLEEALDHMRKNKIETAIKVIGYGAFSLSTLYGVGTSAVIRMMLCSFVNSKAKDLLTDCFYAQLDDWRVQYVFSAISWFVPPPSIGTSPDQLITIAAAKIVLVLEIMQHFAESMEKGKHVFKELKQIVRGDKNWRDIDADTVLKAFDLMLLYYPMRRLPMVAHDFYLSHIVSEAGLVASIDNVVYKRSFMPTFADFKKQAGNAMHEAGKFLRGANAPEAQQTPLLVARALLTN